MTFPACAIFGPERALSIPRLALLPIGYVEPTPPTSKKRIIDLLEKARHVIHERPTTKQKLIEQAQFNDVQTVDDMLRHPNVRGLLLAYEVLRNEVSLARTDQNETKT